MLINSNLAYFTLFQERLKISSLQQLQAKEKEVLENKITQLEAQLEAQNKVIRNLEEKDTLVSTNLKNLESELTLRQQVILFLTYKVCLSLLFEVWLEI